MKVKKQEEFANCEKTFDDNKNYQKVMRFGDETLKETVAEYNKATSKSNEEELRQREEAFQKEKARTARERFLEYEEKFAKESEQLEEDEQQQTELNRQKAMRDEKFAPIALIVIGVVVGFIIMLIKR